MSIYFEAALSCVGNQERKASSNGLKTAALGLPLRFPLRTRKGHYFSAYIKGKFGVLYIAHFQSPFAL
eukprot:c5947_g1_i2 orf=97-300(+)